MSPPERPMPSCISVLSADSVELRVKIVPGASRDKVAGLLGDELKIQVAAPPEKGKANQAVVKLVSRLLGVPASNCSVTRGETIPHKTILVVGVDCDAAVESVRGVV